MTAIPDTLYAVSARVMRHKSIVGESSHARMNSNPAAGSDVVILGCFTPHENHVRRSA